MKKTFQMCAGATIVALAGQAFGQITVDGKVGPGEGALYGSPKWIQNVPTGFGDNASASGCNENDLGNAAAVTTGIEILIPLDVIGSPAGDIRVIAAYANGGHSAFSNQFLPGLPGPGAVALGNARAVDLSSIAGPRFVTVSASAGAVPTVDGTIDAGVYGAALALQTTRSSAGDDTDASNATAGGSELDGLYAVIRGGNLCIMLTGNMKSDFGAKIELFIDTGAGGFNQLAQAAVLPNVDFGALQNMQGDANNAGLTFPAGFSLTHYVTFGCGGNPATYYPNLGDCTTAAGSFLGCNLAGSGTGTLGNCGAAPSTLVALDNSNIAGVGATCPPPNGDPDVATGSEIDNLFAYIDHPNNRLYLLVGGNLESSFNKLDLFIDCAPGGQNVLRGDNVDIDFNGLNHMGGNGTDPGMQFDAAFAADYWIGITNGNSPNENWSNAAVLRTDGPLIGFNAEAYDYGAYNGGLKSANNPIQYNGTNIDAQDGFTGHIFTNYAPRAASDSLILNPAAPVGTPGLLSMAIDNRNIAGVTDSVADPVAAAAVTTGVEYSLDLTELGWDGVSPIRVTGMINNGGHDFTSNQIIGGLPAGSANLGNSPAVNFAAIDGNQFVDLTGCPADFDGD
ncbi:MAG: hypothetical protein AABZ53_11295, partial [Planctomycetota bacterium]